MLGEVFALVAALSFSGAAIFYRAGVRGSQVNPIVLSGLRGMFALALLLVVGFFYRVDFSKPPVFYLAVFLSMLGSFILGDSSFLYGLQRAPLGVVYPVAYTFSVFTALFSHFILGEELTLRDAVSSLLIVLGVALVYSENFSLGKQALVGALAGLSASVSWGAGATLMGLALRWGNAVEVNISRLSMLVIATLPLILKNSSEVFRQVRVHLLALGGILGIGVGPLLFMNSISFIGASRSSIFISSTPVLTVLLSRIFLGEKTGGKLLLGTLAVSAGLALQSL
ncbi:DMT family transporter [Thermofilum pendens]|uniref:DMT family transporter n=1 Tax=Thermofilum pendens TaxID=2269 RepID=UPI000699B956|nr:DMT family transporter [Thermofilum pendens]